MLTVITPATSTDLTTVTRAKALLKFAAEDDVAAKVLIGQASRVIADHCRRTFGLETVRETFFDIDLCGDGPLLARGPVVEILSLYSNEDLLPAMEYRLDDRTGRLVRLDAGGRSLQWWGGSLTVDYRAGYVLPKDETGQPAITLPNTVERAAFMILSTYLSMRGRDPTVKTESTDGVGSTTWWVPGTVDRLVSPEAAQLLAPYVRFYP